MKSEINAVLENMTAATPEPVGLHRRGRFTLLRQVPQAERSLFCAGQGRYLWARPPPGRVRLPESRPRGTGGRREAAQAP